MPAIECEQIICSTGYGRGENVAVFRCDERNEWFDLPGGWNSENREMGMSQKSVEPKQCIGIGLKTQGSAGL